MSDYIYLLESHLNAGQNRLVAELQRAAGEVNQNLYLAGGAMRDMLGGFPIRDLDFTLEGNPLKLAQTVVERLAVREMRQDEHKRFVELVFPGGARAQIAMSRTEKYAKPGAKPQVASASIHDDLRRRDFTMNAIALSLGRGSRGLLIDPTNGLGDLSNREIRTTNSLAFSDDPARLLRLVRLRHRMQFTTEERTARQFENAIAENLQSTIPVATILDELRHIGDEPSPSEILHDLERSGLLVLFSKTFAAGKIDYSALGKLEKVKKSSPLGMRGWVDGWRSFLVVATGKFSPREKSEFYEAAGFGKPEINALKGLVSHAQKLEVELQSPNLRKPSQIYELLAAAAPDEILYVLYGSPQRVVQDRIKHYIQKYLPMAEEVSEAELTAAGAIEGSPKYEKIRQSVIAAKLNARPKKTEPDAVAEFAPPSAGRGRPPRAS